MILVNLQRRVQFWQGDPYAPPCKRINVQDFTQDTVPKNLLIHSFSDSCFGSDCFMPDAGSEPVNTTDNIPAPYMWSASLGETERGTNAAGGNRPEEQ